MRAVVAQETVVTRSPSLFRALLPCLLAVSPAMAQVPLPALPPTTLPGTPVEDTVRNARNAADAALGTLNDYARRIDTLRRREGRRVDVTPAGDAMRRGEYLAIDASADGLARARVAGFTIVRHDADDIAPSIAQLRDTRNRTPARGLRALREAMPDATIDFHHLYLPAGEEAASASAGAPNATPTLHVGLVDGGVDAAHPALSRIKVHRHGCDGRAVPQRHGTQVAGRLVAGATGDLFAADLWCGARAGGDTLGVIDALRWMARQRVPVVNLSLVGPDNAALKRTVEAFASRGVLLVAAAGNDGPAAPPRYPAAYPSVIAVGALDARRHPLPESAAGPHLDFCADGVASRDARGTSFAAPIVAHALARHVAAIGATQALRMLEREAVDVAAPGRDPRCGVGAIASPAAPVP